ncbi:hypothetical protein AC579_5174 [Pseudocercospora musae]|uniref:Uncharacterized protein n=1 Tax=Pseudocercospora musae TaxID=113226 RepID=A0A139I8V6_9PEZI|nr:hypothetical protein AC579_5174 [Pseudocercospora musae]
MKATLIFASIALLVSNVAALVAAPRAIGICLTVSGPETQEPILDNKSDSTSEAKVMVPRSSRSSRSIA